MNGKNQLVVMALGPDRVGLVAQVTGFIRERGGATTRNSQKFDFNRGGHAFVNDLIGRVEEMNMNSNGSDGSYIRVPMAFETYRLAGNAACESFMMLMYLNGVRDRVAVYVEQVDDEFLERHDLDPEGAKQGINYEPEHH